MRAPAVCWKDRQLTSRTQIRIALATTAVVATTGIAAAVHAVAAETEPTGRPSSTVTAAAPIAPAALVVPASMDRSEVEAGKHRADKRVEKRREHARAVRAAKERARAARAEASRERASRSTVRTSTSGGARGLAAQMASSRYGWGSGQFSCLNSLWERESGWNVHASNPSGAYGIPQALPGSKMGGDWRNDAAQQISWGLGYIKGRYGDPCGAWGAFQDKGWY
jgi:hypothetical protein